MSFGTYDFETYDWTKPLCVGVYTPSDANVDSFDFYVNRADPDSVPVMALQLMEHAALAGVKVFWAHNGGKFDVMFVADALKRMPGWSADGALASGRVISLRVYSPRVSFELKDSYAVVQSSLRDALDSFEIPQKKVFTQEDYAALKTDSRAMCKHSDAKLHEGTLADCKSLWLLLKKTEGMFQEWGGQLKSTFSASALSVVKASVGGKLYSHKQHQWANDVCRKAFHGGRVEVYRHQPHGMLREYDFTSSYPWSMTQPLPWELLGWGEPELFNPNILSIVNATVNVPQQYLPPLPYVPSTKGLFFPVGRWNGWFTSVELAYAIEHCGVTATFHEAINYTVAQPFSAFVNKVFADKREATGARRMFAKLVLNGCYGKFGQKPENQTLKLFADRETAIAWERANLAKKPEAVSPDKTALSFMTHRWPSQTHYALAATVTAYSRIILHQALVAAGNVSYCDTDSIHTQSTAALPNLGDNLGQLKVELDNYSASFYAPKLYSLHPLGAPTIYASKGFPVSAESFARIIEGHHVGNPNGRMQLLKTQLRKGAPVRHLEETETEKTWSGRSVKRCVLPYSTEGDTRPWSVRELQEGAHLAHVSPLAPRNP